VYPAETILPPEELRERSGPGGDNLQGRR